MLSRELVVEANWAERYGRKCMYAAQSHGTKPCSVRKDANVANCKRNQARRLCTLAIYYR